MRSISALYASSPSRFICLQGIAVTSENVRNSRFLKIILWDGSKYSISLSACVKGLEAISDISKEPFEDILSGKLSL